MHVRNAVLSDAVKAGGRADRNAARRFAVHRRTFRTGLVGWDANGKTLLSPYRRIVLFSIISNKTSTPPLFVYIRVCVCRRGITNCISHDAFVFETDDATPLCRRSDREFARAHFRNNGDSAPDHRNSSNNNMRSGGGTCFYFTILSDSRSNIIRFKAGHSKKRKNHNFCTFTSLRPPFEKRNVVYIHMSLVFSRKSFSPKIAGGSELFDVLIVK